MLGGINFSRLRANFPPKIPRKARDYRCHAKYAKEIEIWEKEDSNLRVVFNYYYNYPVCLQFCQFELYQKDILFKQHDFEVC